MVKIKPNKLNRIIYIFLTTSMILFLISNNYILFQDYKKVTIDSSKDAINLRLNSLHVDLNNFPRTSVNDIAFLAEMTNTKDLFNKNTEIKNTDLLEFMKQNTAYTQTILLDLKGNEILKIKNNNSNYIEDSSKKENFSDKLFWQEIKNLYNEKIIISDIILEKNEYNEIPTLNYATSIFHKKEPIGYLVLKANANYFLNNIRYAQREGEKVFLIRKDGEYLANADIKKEFSLEKGISFYSDYPEVNKKQILEEQPDFINLKNQLFSFKYITISKGYFTEYSGEEDNLWILISVTDKTKLNFPNILDLIIYEIPACIILIILLVFTIYQRVKK
ncbi:MAG: cache domain-containing protein [Candidatus Pacearchaeota archaeon]|nr:cache domain-containing protein [Candidatus Pacearchaeota archaeon]